MREQIEKILDREIRHKLKEHKGDVKVTRIENGMVYVRMLGSCSDCVFAQTDVEDKIKTVLVKNVSGVKDVSLDTMDPELFSIAKKILDHELTLS